MAVIAWVLASLGYMVWLFWNVSSVSGMVPAPLLTSVSLFVITSGTFILVAVRILRGRSRLRSFWLPLPLAVSFVAAVIALVTPVSIAQATLPDGRTLHLSQEPLPTDVAYDLWREGMAGLLWWKINEDLSYSEDGSFIGDEALHVSGDGRRLLVKRGGIWTDCLDIQSRFRECDAHVAAPVWGGADYIRRMRDHSLALEALK